MRKSECNTTQCLRSDAPSARETGLAQSGQPTPDLMAASTQSAPNVCPHPSSLAGISRVSEVGTDETGACQGDKPGKLDGQIEFFVALRALEVLVERLGGALRAHDRHEARELGRRRHVGFVPQRKVHAAAGTRLRRPASAARLHTTHFTAAFRRISP